MDETAWDTDYELWKDTSRLSDLERLVIIDMYKEGLIKINPHTIVAFWERRGIKVSMSERGY
jgi:hypothetical protein